MAETVDVKNIGLRGVKVADTRISDVDGVKGNLIYRGFNICDLVTYSTFEEVSFLLLYRPSACRSGVEAVSSGTGLGEGDSGCASRFDESASQVSPSHGRASGSDLHPGLL